MKITKITTTAIAAIGAFGVLGAPLAFGDATDADVTKTSIGQQAKLVDGATIQGWTVTGLKPSTDVIDYKPNGTLWEATATDEAIQGGATPIVSNFNARAADGQNYRVLFGVATPQGVNPGALAQGDSTSGKVYFDVTGAAPDTVVYNAGGHDLLVWKPAPPAPVATGGSGSRAICAVSKRSGRVVCSTMRKRSPPRVVMNSRPGLSMSHPVMRAMDPTPWGTAGAPTSPPSRIRHTPNGAFARMQRAAMSR